LIKQKKPQFQILYLKKYLETKYGLFNLFYNENKEIINFPGIVNVFKTIMEFNIELHCV